MINLQVFLSRWHCAWSSGARTRAVVVSYTGREDGSGGKPWGWPGASFGGFEVVNGPSGGMSDATLSAVEEKFTSEVSGLEAKVVRYLPDFDIKRLEHMQVMYQVNVLGYKGTPWEFEKIGEPVLPGAGVDS